MNAVLRKEMRSLLRERRSWLVPTLYAAVMAAAVYLFVFATLDHGGSDVAGMELAGLVAVLQWIAVVIVGPLLGASSFASEREQGTWSRLLASPIARYKIAAGKAAAAWLYVLLLLFVSLPIAALSLFFRGTDLPTLAGLYLTDALIGLTCVCLGLAASIFFHRTWSASLVAMAITLGLTIFSTAIWVALTGSHNPPGSVEREWILYFNPAFSLSLFFIGDTEVASAGAWWAHYGAMMAIAGVSFGFVVARLRGLRE
jgi:ABC-type transport system involved in multi-copper enzyme maturation permease subunit